MQVVELFWKFKVNVVIGIGKGEPTLYVNNAFDKVAHLNIQHQIDCLHLVIVEYENLIVINKPN